MAIYDFVRLRIPTVQEWPPGPRSRQTFAVLLRRISVGRVPSISQRQLSLKTIDPFGPSAVRYWPHPQSLASPSDRYKTSTSQQPLRRTYLRSWNLSVQGVHNTLLGRKPSISDVALMKSRKNGLGYHSISKRRRVHITYEATTRTVGAIANLKSSRTLITAVWRRSRDKSPESVCGRTPSS